MSVQERPVTSDEEVVTIELSDEALEGLKEIARLRKTSLEEALQFALASELFILRAASKPGSKVLIKNPGQAAHEYSLSGD